MCPLSTLMMESVLVSETLVVNRTLMLQIVREHFIAFICRESFKSCIRLKLRLFPDQPSSGQR
jgi:hypothetical protein